MEATSLKRTAAKLTTSMQLDTSAGPATITGVARSLGGLFAATDQVVVTFVIGEVERQAVFTPGQKISVFG
jgi:hypothetical protein